MWIWAYFAYSPIQCIQWNTGSVPQHMYLGGDSYVDRRYQQYHLYATN